MNYLIFVFISLITKVFCQNNQNDMLQLVMKNIADPNNKDNANVLLSLLKDVDLKSINSSLDLPSLIKNLGNPEFTKNLDLTSILKDIDLQSAIKDGNVEAINKIVNTLSENKNVETKLVNNILDTNSENKSLDKPLSLENNSLPEKVVNGNQNLGLSSVDKSVKPETENEGLDNQAGNQILEPQPENQQLEPQPENQQLEPQSENQQLENQLENQNLDTIQDAYNGLDYAVEDQNKQAADTGVQSILKNLDLGSILGKTDLGPLGSLAKNMDLGSLLKNMDLGPLGSLAENMDLGSLAENMGLGSLTENMGLGSLTENMGLGSLTENMDLGSLTKNFDLLEFIKKPDLGSLMKNLDIGSLFKNVDIFSLVTNPKMGSLFKNLDIMTLLTKPDLPTILNSLDFGVLLDKDNLLSLVDMLGFRSMLNNSKISFVFDLLEQGSTFMDKINYVKGFYDNPYKSIADNILPSNISHTCQLQVQAMLRDMAQVNGLPSYLKNWGLQMIDSSGKVPSGLSTGNVLWFGNILECLSTKIPVDDLIKNEESIGEFCMVNLYPNFTGYSDVDIRWAFCSPQACSISDKLTFLSYYGNKWNVRTNIGKTACQTKDTEKLDSTAIQLIVLLLIPIGLVLLATLIDACFSVTDDSATDHNTSVFATFCKFFSAIPAFNYLFSSEENEKKESVDFFWGIRAIFVLIIIWFSVIRVAMEENPWKSPLNINEIVKRPFVSLLNHQNIVMNNVLFLSGFWLSFTVFRNKIFQHFSILTRFVYRYIRITVPYLYFIAFISGPFLYYITAPEYPIALKLRDTCRDTWFEKILYLTKFTDGFQPDKCIFGEWYFAAEMQLYLLALPLVVLLMWKPKLGLQGLFLVFFISTTALIAVILHDKKYLFTSVSNQLYYKTDEMSHYFNPQSAFRASSSVLGIFLGYLIIEYKHKFQLSKGFAIFTKLLLPVTMIITYIFNSSYIDENLMPQFMQIFYATFWNLFCHFVLACIIILCYFNPEDICNRFLSSNFLLPIGKLSFAMYLVNAEIIKGRLLIRKDPLYLSYDQLKLEYLTLITCSFMAASAIFFVIESPLYRMMKKISPAPNNVNLNGKSVNV